jgi:hypothetical protein
VGIAAACPDASNGALMSIAADWISRADARGYFANRAASAGEKLIISDTDDAQTERIEEGWVRRTFRRRPGPAIDCAGPVHRGGGRG